MEDLSCFLLVLWLCRLHVGVHPSHFNFPYAARPGKAPSQAQPGAKPGTSPDPSPQQVLNSVWVSSPETENSEMILETFCFSVSTFHTPPIQEMMWREISYVFEAPVSLIDFLWFLCPQNGGMSWMEWLLESALCPEGLHAPVSAAPVILTASTVLCRLQTDGVCL